MGRTEGFERAGIGYHDRIAKVPHLRTIGRALVRQDITDWKRW
ncbi:hypothetical protein [Notoacmeibacter marinus]|nr:hypothetical protein [Notoacmeibacter marinus]